jgi:hypothetical protein
MIILVIKWLFLVSFNVLLKYFVAWPLTPVIVLFVNKSGELPVWLFWFTTPDNPKLQDYGWIRESRPYLHERNGYQRYVNRCFWLWRNSLYGFNESVLSIKFDADNESLVTVGNANVGNGPGGISGTVKRYLYSHGKIKAWQWYFIKQLPFCKSKCIRINLGYKLWSWGDPAYKSGHAALVCWVNKFTP